MVETSRLVQHGSAWVEKRIGYHVQLVEKKKDENTDEIRIGAFTLTRSGQGL